MTRVVFSTGSLYPFGLDRIFGWVAETGFDGIEVMMDDRWDTHEAQYMNALSERHDLPILALHPPIYRGAWRLRAVFTTTEQVAGIRSQSRNPGCLLG